VLCVTEIPGEVEAEVRYALDLDDNTRYARIAKRTRDDPHDYIWEFNGVDAHTTTTDPVYCIDSSLAADATAPGGQRVTVTFAGDQTMQRRCFWPVTSDLVSYYGKFIAFVIAKMEGTTDTATLKVYLRDESNYIGGELTRDVSGTTWRLKDGWDVLCYRVGTWDDDLFSAGNDFELQIYASTDGTPTDYLHIACAFLVPVDEGLIAAGGATLLTAAVGPELYIKDLDGDRGAFAYMGGAFDTYLPNQGMIGNFPFLSPEVENWLYFVLTHTMDGYTFDDSWKVSLTYRPRGIFLRGSNP